MSKSIWFGNAFVRPVSIFALCLALIAANFDLAAAAKHRSLSSLKLNPTTVVSGNPSQGTVTLTGAAPSGGAAVSLSSSNVAVATVPASVTVPPGATTATFTAATKAVGVSTSVTISGTYGGRTKSGQLYVNPPSPPAPGLSNVTLNPTSVIGGSPSQGTVTLTGAAPNGGAAVSLSSSNTSVATVPASVTVNVGATAASFSVATSSVSAPTSVTISGAYGGTTKSAELSVNPSLPPPSGPQFFAAPNGSPNGNGSITSPWDLQSAFNKPASAIPPGSTLYLRGGVYNGAALSGFKCNLAGTPSSPVTVRNYLGERAIVDRAGSDSTGQAALTVNGSYVWFWGLEIANSYTNRSRTSPFTGTVKAWRGPGVYVQYGNYCKFINCIIHDNGSAIYDKQNGTEIYGCLLYFNGNSGFEHGMYIGNELDTKVVKDNLIFDNGGLGIQSYSSHPTSGQQKGIRIEGNASFNNGAITLDDQNSTNILVGAEVGVSAERTSVLNNYIYDPALVVSNKSKGLRLGQADQDNKDAVITDNYIACKVPLTVQWWNYVELQRNTIFTPTTSVNLQMQSGDTTDSYLWDNNTEISGRSTGPIFTYNSSSSLSFANWRQQTGLDAASQVVQNPLLRPTGAWVFVRPNQYEAGRGHIVVFNWDLIGAVSIDVSAVGLQLGDQYEVRDSQNYFGAPVASGLYDGNPIMLPMILTNIGVPIGSIERLPVHTAPEFVAFVIRKL